MDQNVSDNKWKNVQKLQTIQPVENLGIYSCFQLLTQCLKKLIKNVLSAAP